MNEQSGLLGVSGRSGDMRDLLASPDPAAQLAIDLYCYRIRKYLGAYLAVLQGTDAILFSGGVGENSANIRQRILEPFQYCGISLNLQSNEAVVGICASIHEETSSAAVWVMPAEEDLMLLKQAHPLITAWLARNNENESL